MLKWTLLVLALPGLASAQALEMTSTAFAPGESGSFTVDGGETPLAIGQGVWFMFGASEGPGPCPIYLDGDCWDIPSPKFIHVEWADASREATWDRA
jgi:hypothetical protein